MFGSFSTFPYFLPRFRVHRRFLFPHSTDNSPFFSPRKTIDNAIESNEKHNKLIGLLEGFSVFRSFSFRVFFLKKRIELRFRKPLRLLLHMTKLGTEGRSIKSRKSGRAIRCGISKDTTVGE